jgi:hypothetical protein
MDRAAMAFHLAMGEAKSLNRHIVCNGNIK